MDLRFVQDMSDRELLARVQQLACDERHATANLVAHLSEMERRKLYLEQGCRSLFTYCTQVLHLAENTAYNRIEAARIALRFPAVLTHLAAGHVHLTAIRLIGPCLTHDNHHQLLDAARHKSKREIEEMIARLRPRPDAATLVRKVPAGTVGPEVAETRTAEVVPEPLLIVNSGAAATGPMSTAAANGGAVPNEGASAVRAGAARVAAQSPRVGSPVGPARAATNIVPLAPERYKVQFTASAATCAKLRRAQELLQHRIPGGDVATVIDAALDLLVRDLEKKKFGAVNRPRSAHGADGTQPGAALRPAARPSRPAPAPSGPPAAAARPSRPAPSAGPAPATATSRHIPADVKRAVWQRDGGRCTFVGMNGMRCTERGQLEFDHVQPHADGGAATLANMRLLCRWHNQHEANLFFGKWQVEPAGANHSFQNESALGAGSAG